MKWKYQKTIDTLGSLILVTPTGGVRNRLTDANMLIMSCYGEFLKPLKEILEAERIAKQIAKGQLKKENGLG